MPAPRRLLPLLLVVGLTAGASLLPGPESRPGVCPNQLSPHLWVDAQSTCERECVQDEVSEGPQRHLVGDWRGETWTLNPRSPLPPWLPTLSCPGSQGSPI